MQIIQPITSDLKLGGYELGFCCGFKLPQSTSVQSSLQADVVNLHEIRMLAVGHNKRNNQKTSENDQRGGALGEQIQTFTLG